MDRILATHTGSLVRPAELLAFPAAKERGQEIDEDAYQRCLRDSVADVVRRQVQAGIDVPDDGEMGKATWITYLYERVSGLEVRPIQLEGATMLPPSRDRQAFPGAYAALDALDEAASRESIAAATNALPDEDSAAAGQGVAWVCTGPLIYDRSALDRDIANFKAALAAHQHEHEVVDAFLPVVAPASAYWLQNEQYPSEEEFVFALAALREEYRAIVEAGLLVQVDDAVMMHEADRAGQRPPRARVAGVGGGAPARGQEVDPGVVTHHTNVVEHPELVAQRLIRLAGLVGRENVLAGTDCGFAQGAFIQRVHPEIQWAKLQALADGARLASRELWGAKAAA